MKLVRKMGFALFLLSFLMGPSWTDFHPFAGLAIFIQTPFLAWQTVTDPYSSHGHATFLGAVMLAAWVANITVLVRLPMFAAVVASILPWVAYVVLFSDLCRFAPFYFWAVGIAIIHLARP